MPEVYEHHAGGLVIDSPDQIEVLIKTATKPVDKPQNRIAFSPAFNLAGQGTSIEEAQSSLTSVLTNHLDPNLRTLEEALLDPWEKTEPPEEELAELREAFKTSFNNVLQFTISKSK